MKTIKQVSDLTGISVRMLHYYDKIGLLKPSNFTDAGYRLYDDEALGTLQQILFFKELDIPLKEVKEIMVSTHFDKMQSLENQKKLLIIKRDRVNSLIELINKTLKGANTMSFKEFDMTEYYNVWEEYKKKNMDKVIKTWGSIDKFDEMIEHIKINEAKIAKNSIEAYGSIKKCAEDMKKTLYNETLITIAEKRKEFEKDCLEDNHPILKELYKKLTIDLGKDPSAKEIQQIAKEITDTVKKDYEIFKMNKKGDDYWYYTTKKYLQDPKWIKTVDKDYGRGAAEFIGEVFKIYLKDKRPKLERLYDKLAVDLSKDPTSEEIQQIVQEIADTTKSNKEFYVGDTGLNYKVFLSSLADLYLTNASKNINAADKVYGKGSAKFIGEALKFYAEK
ncbi:MerR family transcriptional regulator [Clostridium estertheticum]|uniref:MerR family transcriptional regulator n=1 Tax=Clostridium estertheticum TaxID=238834 RepID=UPI001C0BE799|nr:MerR family transcriptional regulator [Clostridium estertheticum]MBU3199862.1 MerR family transcriptional regulator [Clostridium estertheticum]WAG67038.1 MerR family transcriptional regulator [Clostridium estertheticum]